MVGRILELTAPGLSVHKRRGFLAVDTDGGEAGRIAFDELEAVLVASPGMVWSNSALVELAARQVPVMVLGHDFNPVAMVLPLNGHFQQAHRIRAQADASLPFRKQAWATLVRHKITAQAEALERVNEPSERLRRLATAVRSGDPDNREAQAAQAWDIERVVSSVVEDRVEKGAVDVDRAWLVACARNEEPLVDVRAVVTRRAGDPEIARGASEDLRAVEQHVAESDERQVGLVDALLLEIEDEQWQRVLIEDVGARWQAWRHFDGATAEHGGFR